MSGVRLEAKVTSSSAAVSTRSNIVKSAADGLQVADIVLEPARFGGSGAGRGRRMGRAGDIGGGRPAIRGAIQHTSVIPVRGNLT